MAEGTVRGTFDLNVSRPVREVRKLRGEAVKTDKVFERLGDRMDRLGSQEQVTRIRLYRQQVRGLARDAKALDTQWGRTTRSIERNSKRQVRAVRSVRTEVKRLDSTTATINIDLRGVERALTQIELLHRRMRSLGRQRATPHVGVGGGFGGAGVAGRLSGAGGRAGGGGAFIGTSGFGIATSRMRVLVGAGAAALPVIQSLGGAVVALGSSFAMAAGGATAVGAAGLGGLIAGLGSLAAVGATATGRISEVWKAQTKFAEATSDATSAQETARASAERMRSSQQRLTDAQRQARYAQEDLTRARRDARRELVNMALAQERSRLSEGRARLALRQARAEARRVQDDPLSTGVERTEARLGLQEARLGLRESRIERGRSTADLRRARAGGVQGMPTVVAARRGAQDARRQVTEARRGLREAGEEMARGATTIARAKEELDEAFRRAPQGTRGLIRDFTRLRRLWGYEGPQGADPGVARAQGGFVGLLRTGLGIARGMTPLAGQVGGRAVRATNREARGLGRFTRSRRFARGVRAGGAAFDENLGAVRRTTENIVETWGNITRAARPFLREAADFIESWTGGWARSTRDVAGTQRKIAAMVGHFRSWRRLIGAGGGLLGSIVGAAAPSGQSAVDRLTLQFRRWEAWIDRNPRKVRDFFRRTVNSAVEMAKALARIAEALSDIATALSPVLDRFSQLVSLAGSLGMLTPGAGALALGAFRGARGGGGGGGGLLGRFGRGGRAARGAGGAGAAAGAVGRRGAGAVLGGAARGAGRAFWPIALGMGVLDFASTQGGAGQKLGTAVSGATLGILPRPLSDPELADRGAGRAQRFIEGLPTSVRGQGGAITALRGRIGAVHSRAALPYVEDAQGFRTAIGGGERKQLRAENARLREELAVRVQAWRQYKRDRDRALDATSRGKVPRLFAEFQEGNRRRQARGASPADAMREQVSGTLKQIKHMRTAGGRELAQTTLDWARRQARANPALQGQYERLARGVEKRFAGLRGNVRVVEGQILDGSRSQWKSIAGAISSAARRGVDDTSAEFARLRRLALGSLQEMGYSRRQARRLFSDMRAGGSRATNARSDAASGPTGAGQRPSVSARNNLRSHQGPSGDGIGAGPGETRTGANTGSGMLRGANPNMLGYAQIGQRFGGSVTSGLRPGAITSSGNPSYHGSGHAIDIGGPMRALRRTARMLYTRYGRNLEELISPFPEFSIKDGRPFRYSADLIAQHSGGNAHVHVADTNPPMMGGARGLGLFGVPGAGAARVRSRASRLAGVPGALSTAAGAGYAQAINRRLRQAAGGGGPVVGGGSMSANRRLARQMMLAQGWGPGQWSALNALWTGESNFDHTAVNPSSGATGIPQSLPGSKMASAGEDWRTNPATQIKWGLGYIRGRYGSPAAALQAWQGRSPHWYGRGGQGVYRRPTMIGVGDGQPSGGSEEVTVRRLRPGQRRARRGGGGGRTVHLTLDLRGAVVKSEDDARELMEKAANHAAKKLLKVLDDAEGDEELMG